MDWVFAHLKLILAVAGMIAYMVTKAREAKFRRDADQFDREQREAERGGYAPQQSEVAERTRRIQEEIRRKILERQRGSEARTGAPFESRPSTVNPPPVPLKLRKPSPPALPASAPSAAQTEAILAKQRELVETLRAIEEQKMATARRRAAEAMTAKVEHHEAVYATTPVVSASGHRLLGDLKERNSLRRAIVLREVLGSPVALR